MLDAFSAPPPGGRPMYMQGERPPPRNYYRPPPSRRQPQYYPEDDRSYRSRNRPPPPAGFRRNPDPSRRPPPPNLRYQGPPQPRPVVQRPPRKSSIASTAAPREVPENPVFYDTDEEPPPPRLPFSDQAPDGLRHGRSRSKTMPTREDNGAMSLDGSFGRPRSRTAPQSDMALPNLQKPPMLDRVRTEPSRSIDYGFSDERKPWTPSEVVNVPVEDLPPVPMLRMSTSVPDYRRLKAACPSPRAAFAPSAPFGRSGRSSSETDRSPTYPSTRPLTSGNATSTTESFESGLTFGTSTARSSIMTRRSSGGGLSGQGPVVPAVGDEDFSIEEYISLYARGFEDEPGPRQFYPPSMGRKIAQSPLGMQGNFQPRHKKSPTLVLSPPRKSSLKSPRPSPSASNDTPTTPAQPTEPSRPETPPVPALPPVPVIGDTVADAAELLRPPSVVPGVIPPPAPPSPPPLENIELPVIPRDHYGFKKETQYTTVAQHEAWEVSYAPYLQRRREKWEALMKSNGLGTYRPTKFPARSDKVKRFVRKGIPPDWRGAAWFWYSGGQDRMKQNPTLYQKLMGQIKNGELSENDRELIERDLYRTFPDSDRFKPDPTVEELQNQILGKEVRPAPGSSEENYMIQSLRNVLQAFAVCHPKIGYCQSLNFLAGNLLLFLDGNEEKTFHLLCILTSEFLPGTHGLTLEGANVDISVLMQTLQETMPSLYAKLGDHVKAPQNNKASHRRSASSDYSNYGSKHTSSSELPTVSLATTAWFMSCFVSTLPIETTCRVWDCLFYEGSKTLFRVALGIFKLCNPAIQKIKDPMEIFQLVQTFPRGLLDANSLMEATFGGPGAGRGLEGRGLLSGDDIQRKRSTGRKSISLKRSGGQTKTTEPDVPLPPLNTSDIPKPAEETTPTSPHPEKKSPLSRAASFKKLGRLRSISARTSASSRKSSASMASSNATTAADAEELPPMPTGLRSASQSAGHSSTRRIID